MFEFLAAMMAMKLIDEMFEDYERLVNSHARRDSAQAARRAIGAKKQQLWQQVEALKATGHELSAQYEQTREQIGWLKSLPRSPGVSSQLQHARGTLEQVRAQQAALKDVRQHIHEQMARLKAQGLQLSC